MRFGRAQEDSHIGDADRGKIQQATKTTRLSVFNKITELFGTDAINTDLWEELEEALIGADVGVKTSFEILDRLKAKKPKTRSEMKEALRNSLIEILESVDDTAGKLWGDDELNLNLKMVNSPAVVLVVGVNGSGKTTVIGRLASLYIKEGYRVMAAAGDTYRAAAIDQLQAWATAVGFDVIAQQSGADPAAVAFDAINAGKARLYDLIIIDTAGRLQNKTSLMDELAKIKRVITRQINREPDEVLLVIDSTTGQNGLMQAEVFAKEAGVTSIALSKLDGAGRGGIAFAIAQEYGLPVKFVGVGEHADDLIPFIPESFVDALLLDRED
ncbi:MAG: signal recognition particle-docking protein FtsY [Chloroflexota bacterium]|nr:signal recognition particle-docking protein FtsY [Chloroflexota bacterium]